MHPTSLFEIVAMFKRHGLPFVIVGGHAVVFHGHIRATEDVDLVWLRSPETERLLQQALQELKAQWISDEIDPATGLERAVPVSPAYIASTHLMMLITDAGFLDLFDYVPGHPSASVEELFNEAVMHEGVRYASLEWMRRMKRVSGRPKDLSDLENLT